MTTTSVLGLFRILAAEFAATADASVEAVIDIVTLHVSSAAFGARTSEALARLTAHELTLLARAAAVAAGNAGVGAVTSLSAGDVSVSYGGLSTSSIAGDDHLRQTHHGLAFLAIRDSRAEVGFGLLT